MTMMKKMMQRLGDEVGVEEALASGLKKKKGRVILPLCIFIWNSEFGGRLLNL